MSKYSQLKFLELSGALKTEVHLQPVTNHHLAGVHWTHPWTLKADKKPVRHHLVGATEIIKYI